MLTTKHHEGFCLWPTALPHPRKGRYHAKRDIVGDLRTAVLEAGMRMGLYYSGGYDWPYNDALLKNPADSFLAMPHTPDYLRYAAAHVQDLIERYRPSILWNDIGWPAGGDLPRCSPTITTPFPTASSTTGGSSRPGIAVPSPTRWLAREALWCNGFGR